MIYTGDLTRIVNRGENLEEMPRRRSNWKIPDTDGNESCLVLFIHLFMLYSHIHLIIKKRLLNISNVPKQVIDLDLWAAV